MNTRSALALAAFAVLIALPAWATSPGEVLDQLAQCSELTDAAKRLACYDALADQTRTIAAAAKKPAERSEADKESVFGFDFGNLFNSSPEPETKPEDFGKNQLPQTHPQPEEGQVIDSIAANVTDYAMTPFGKFIVFLDNGQVWRQVSGDTGVAQFLHEAKANKVLISRGLLESYNLRLNEQGPIYKVIRVK